MLRNGKSISEIHDETGIPARTLRRWRTRDREGEVEIKSNGIRIGNIFYQENLEQKPTDALATYQLKENAKGVKLEGDGEEKMVATYRTETVRTLEGLLEVCNLDPEVWEVERWVANKWDVVAKTNVDTGNSRFPEHELQATELWQVKAWFQRKTPEKRSIEQLLDEMKTNSVVVPAFVQTVDPGQPRRELEISLMDPHLGLHCFAPESDLPQTIESIEQLMLDMIERLVTKAQTYGPFERVLLPLGNDYMHVDGVFHSTTAGTPQPEADAWAHVFVRAEKLGIAMIDRLLEVAPVKAVIVPGNHDRQSSFCLGRLWNAYYHNNENVEFDCDSSPYKFHHFGVNLIGFEHGHSVQAVRLAALMANECRTRGWADARYCEWHLGDQHRKGSSKPSMFEEQGVSIEYLPGLASPNSWHRIKSFNHQQRAGMAFIWDYHEGPQARLQVNLDNLIGTFMNGDHLK
jgi:hypothetical protein